MHTATNTAGKTLGRLLLILAVGLALLSGSRMWTNAQASASEDFNIYLASTSFDPAAYVPPAPGGLAVTSEQAAQGTYSWQVRTNKTSESAGANNGTRWSFLVGPPYQVFLPLVLKNATTAPSGIVNGDFEAGANGWTEYSLQDLYPVITSVFPAYATAHSGSNAVWLGGGYDEISSIEQSVTISAGAPYLVYWHWIDSEDTCDSPGPYDFGKVLINGSAIDTYPLCAATSTDGWVRHSVNLSTYAGQTVTLQIRAETDGSLNSNLFVDDVTLQASTAAFAGNDFVPSRVPPEAQTKPGIIP